MSNVNNLKVVLLHNSPLWLAAHSCRMSHDNHDKSDTLDVYDVESGKHIEKITGLKDKALIERVGNKLKHKSILEQLVYWFDIDGISRACLQELARHRTARLTVKSSRYTLKELMKENSNMSDFLVKTGLEYYDDANVDTLDMVRDALMAGSSNDIVKYMLPEAFKTRLIWQIDGRNLQNFLELRSNKDALAEIRQLAREIYTALPAEHQYLYEAYMKDN